MKRLMTTAAMALVIGTGAYAQSNDSSFIDYSAQAEAQGQLFASDLIGSRVYATEQKVDANATVEPGAQNEWDDIGEINDIILSKDGSVQAVIVGVGGFLGIGERDVAVSMDQINMVKDGEEADDYFLVINASRNQIENAPAYEPKTAGEEAADAGNAASGDGQMATGGDQMASGDAAATGAATGAAAGASTDMAASDTANADATASTDGNTDMAAGDNANMDANASTEGETDMASGDDAGGDSAMKADEQTDMASGDAANTDATASTEGDTQMAAGDTKAATDEAMSADSSTETADATASGDAAATADTGEQTDMAADDSNTEMKDTAAAGGDEVASDNAMDSENGDQMASGDAQVQAAPDVQREGYVRADAGEITADELDGSNVYGTDDKSVGEIDKLLLNDQGEVDRVVINVGGFLGLGEKPIAVPFDKLTLLQQDGGDDVRVYIDATEDALKAQPRYEEPKNAD